MTSTNMVKWQCGRCREKGTLPVLHDAGVNTIRYAIERGHDRRAPGCHLLHGIKHVRAEHEGKTMRFATSAPPEDGTDTVAGREASRR